MISLFRFARPVASVETRHLDPLEARIQALKMASWLTLSSSPRDTTSNARPMIAWLQEASSARDYQARLAALQQQRINNGPENFLYDDRDRRRFMENARALHEFLHPKGPKASG